MIPQHVLNDTYLDDMNTMAAADVGFCFVHVLCLYIRFFCVSFLSLYVVSSFVSCKVMDFF